MELKCRHVVRVLVVYAAVRTDPLTGPLRTHPEFRRLVGEPAR